MSLKNAKIAVIGLGYVGLPLAVEFGKKRSVIGYDVNRDRIAELRKSLDRTRECTPNELRDARHLSYSADENELSGCGVYIVTVPTPIDDANRPDLRPLIAASELVARHLNVGDVVIYESTVFPGATEEVCVPILEQVSGLKFNIDFFCGYSPERINPGDKVNTLTTVKKVVSGSNKAAGDAIERLYQEIITGGTWRASSIKVAEASKVIENTQRDINIAFVNELAVIFERLGIDTTEVLEAAGSKWNFLPFKPGMVGGHCIGVDPYYLTHKAEQVGYIPQIVLAGRRMNDNMARYAAKNIVKLMSLQGIVLSQSKIGILGVTFKENCPDTRNSKVFDMIDEFVSWGMTVEICDPWVDPKEANERHDYDLKRLDELSELDAIVVAVSHQEFRLMDPAELKKLCSNRARVVLGDLKSLYDREVCNEIGFDVYRF
ncbi:MAG: nucleotide sugar dehydrogenase [Candidatus Micropelagos thuwalensis]